jgi:hypothetical protein
MRKRRFLREKSKTFKLIENRRKNKNRVQIFIFTLLGLLLIATSILVMFKYYKIKKIQDMEVKKLGGFESVLNTNSYSFDILCFEIQDENGIIKMNNIHLRRFNLWDVKIPAGVYIGDEEGEYFSIEKLYAVGGRLKNRDNGMLYVKDNIDRVFGVELDGYIALSIEGYSGSPCDFLFEKLNNKNLIFNTSDVEKVLNSTFSNFKVWELFALAKSSHMDIPKKSIDSNRCEIIDYKGETIRVFTQECIDYTILQFPRPTALKLEQARVDVYNATGVHKLASKMARRFRNSGIEVVRVEDAPKFEDNSVIYVTNSSSFANTLSVITDQIGIKDIKVKYENTPFVSTGDIVVVLGKDALGI